LNGTSPNWDSQNGLATAGSLYGPLGVYVDRRDTLYVGDGGNNRVLHYLKPASVLNGAHFQPSVPIAPGTLVSLFGSGLADSSASAPSMPLPFSLMNRQVVVNDNVAAALFYVGAGQINLQVPSACPMGSPRVAVRTADTAELIAGTTVAVAVASPGFFTMSQNGTGQGAVLNQDGTLNSASNPAVKGSVIQLYGTGQGAVSPAVADGAPAPSSPPATTVAVPTSDGNTCLNSQPSVCIAIGSTFGDIQFSGLAPGAVGLWQLNVKIPTDALSGAVPVRAVIDGAPSNIVTVSIK
jgi:uncharacterized protein (TIGR03437 family)